MDKRSALRLKTGTEIIFTGHGNTGVATQKGMPMRRGRVKRVTKNGGILVMELAYCHPHDEICETWLPYNHIVKKV